MNTIAERRDEIEQRIAYATAELRRLQAECEHTFATREAQSNTGNYDPSNDRYWWLYRCPCCGRGWTEDQ